ncbi:LysR family transcriptional regulator [Pectobacteriaceae bacterium CE90]|nr:LysR family transcriptional regulator [Prodigiosinella sp. LS101]WJV55897.1 LysR family transcriptional regulator [Prodigiosinella sp. LS101]WJV60258.1 LysR family transcriptional regulator [Pectobacteriaceae bacterium C111]WJY16988.1 LysR family transcriptional regulator [Pectobacteriaceae bacterium CE90]
MLTKTTLEQWELLRAVIEYGGFAQAAEASNRSQSSVSYQISVLQKRIGVPLLKQVGRKAELTAQGQLLLSQALPLLAAFRDLESRAEGLKRGVRARIDLVVDCIFPKNHLFAVLRAFQQRHPLTQIHLAEVLRSESPAQLTDKDADIWLITQPADGITRGRLLMEIMFVAIAHCDHPLHQISAPLSNNDLARYPLIEFVDRRQQKNSRRMPVSAENWTFTTVEAAIEAITHGVGYGWLPESRIRHWLDCGELKPLPLIQGAHRATSLYLVVNEEKQFFDQEVNTLVQLLMDEVSDAVG